MPPASFDNPLTELRLLAGKILTDYAPIVAAVGGTEAIQIWGRQVDARGDLRDAQVPGYRLEMSDVDTRVDFDDSSSTARIIARYAIAVYTGRPDLPPVEYLRWQIIKGACYLFMRREPGTSDPLDDSAIAPLRNLDIKVVQADPEREPRDDVEEWTDVCDVVAIAEVDFADLTTES